MNPLVTQIIGDEFDAASIEVVDAGEGWVLLRVRDSLVKISGDDIKEFYSWAGEKGLGLQRPEGFVDEGGGDDWKGDDPQEMVC